MLLPSMTRLMSSADVDYRREELTREFARANRGRDARARRRAARAAAREHIEHTGQGHTGHTELTGHHSKRATTHEVPTA